MGLAVPGKAVGRHHHPLRPSIPLPDKNRAGSKLCSLLVEAGEPSGRYRASFFRNRSVQHLLRLVIEVTKAISLNPIGDDCKQQMPCQMSRSKSLKHALPTCTEPFEIETAQMRDLVLSRGFGRDTTATTTPLHRINSPSWPDKRQQVKLCRR